LRPIVDSCFLCGSRASSPVPTQQNSSFVNTLLILRCKYTRLPSKSFHSLCTHTSHTRITPYAQERNPTSHLYYHHQPTRHFCSPETIISTERILLHSGGKLGNMAWRGLQLNFEQSKQAYLEFLFACAGAFFVACMSAICACFPLFVCSSDTLHFGREGDTSGKIPRDAGNRAFQQK